MRQGMLLHARCHCDYSKLRITFGPAMSCVGLNSVKSMVFCKLLQTGILFVP